MLRRRTDTTRTLTMARPKGVIGPGRNDQADREWANYFKRLHQRPDISVPGDRRGGSITDHYLAYRKRCEDKGETPMSFGKWNVARDSDISIY
jgi:hypothetical protein